MFSGSCVALVTPMTTTQAIDLTAFEQLIAWHIEQETAAIVVAGTTGEGPTLRIEEYQDLLTLACQMGKGRLPVIAGTGTNATATTIQLTQLAQKAGVDACLIVTPYYNRPMQNGLIEHYTAVANATDLPIILYNVPLRTGCDLLPDTVGTLSQLDNIVAIKEATSNLARLASLQQACPADFKFYSGDDGTCLAFMQQGGHGVISVAANVAPRLMHRLCQAIIQQDLTLAQELDTMLQPLFRLLAIESNPIPVKWALAHLGKVQEALRLPLTTLSTAHQEKLAQALAVLDDEWKKL